MQGTRQPRLTKWKGRLSSWFARGLRLPLQRMPGIGPTRQEKIVSVPAQSAPSLDVGYASAIEHTTSRFHDGVVLHPKSRPNEQDQARGYLDGPAMRAFYATPIRDPSALPDLSGSHVARRNSSPTRQLPATNVRTVCMACMKNEAALGCRLCHKDGCIRRNNDPQNPLRVNFYWCTQAGCSMCRQEIPQERQCQICHIRNKQRTCGLCHDSRCRTEHLRVHPERQYRCSSTCRKCNPHLCAQCPMRRMVGCVLCHREECRKLFKNKQSRPGGEKRAAHECGWSGCTRCYAAPSTIVRKPLPTPKPSKCKLCFAAASEGCDYCNTSRCMRTHLRKLRDVGRDGSYGCQRPECSVCRKRVQARKCLICRLPTTSVVGCGVCHRISCVVGYKASTTASHEGLLPYRCPESTCRVCWLNPTGRRRCRFCKLDCRDSCGLCGTQECRSRVEGHNKQHVTGSKAVAAWTCRWPGCETCSASQALTHTARILRRQQSGIRTA